MAAAAAIDPGIEALPVGGAGMQRRRGPKPGPKAPRGLRREGDFRHQHKRLLAGLEHALDGAHVHLGLAAARDALQKMHRRRATRGVDRGHGLALLIGKLDVTRRDAIGRFERHAPHQAPPLQRLQHAPRHADRRDIGIVHAAVFDQRGKCPALRRRARQGRRRRIHRWLPRQHPRCLRRSATPRQLRQQGGVGAADGVVVVARQPVRELDEVWRQERRLVEHLANRLEVVLRAFRLARHHAHRLGTAERNPHPAPRCRQETIVSHSIVKQAAQRSRHRNRNDLHSEIPRRATRP